MLLLAAVLSACCYDGCYVGCYAGCLLCWLLCWLLHACWLRCRLLRWLAPCYCWLLCWLFALLACHCYCWLLVLAAMLAAMPACCVLLLAAMLTAMLAAFLAASCWLAAMLAAMLACRLFLLAAMLAVCCFRPGAACSCDSRLCTQAGAFSRLGTACEGDGAVFLLRTLVEGAARIQGSAVGLRGRSATSSVWHLPCLSGANLVAA